MEKKSILGMLFSTLAGHLGSNIFLKRFMKTKAFRNTMLESFQNIPQTKPQKFLSTLKAIPAGALMPEYNIMKKQMYDYGQTMADNLAKKGINIKNLSDSQKQFIDDVASYNFKEVANKYNPNDPFHRIMLSQLDGVLNKRGVNIDLNQLMLHPKRDSFLDGLSGILNKSDYPLTSNIMNKALKSDSLTQIQQGVMQGNKATQLANATGLLSNFFITNPMLSPIQGGVQLFKNYLGSPKAPKIMQKTFVSDPLKNAFEIGKQTGVFNPNSLKNKAYELGVNSATQNMFNQAGEIGNLFNKYEIK